MGDNPFAEPGDPDRTIVRPAQGGLHVAPRTPAPAAVPSGPDLQAVSAGDGPLAIAAAPLLHVLARLRNAATAPDPVAMRRRIQDELDAFERRARELGAGPDQVRLVHYALCAALDDVVLNTPWGSHGRWREEPLARALHGDANAGRGFFDQLRSLREGMPASRPVVEVMLLCLSLGMMGPFRALADGPAQLDRARHHVFEMIAAAAPPAAAALAPEAAGVRIPPPPRGGLPVWVAGSAALAVVAGAYAWSLSSLNARSDETYHAGLAAIPATMPELVRPPATPEPPPPPEPPPGLDAQLRAALPGVPGVEVIATGGTVTLRLPASALFPAPNATLVPGSLLERVAAALAPVPGPIRVLGYTDSQAFRSVAFPSNFALSAARAKAVRTALARTVPNPARIAAEGRADADPVAANATPEGRERNRRIDIMLPGLP